MDIQRVRNLTTGFLHTEMNHIYEDIEYIVGDAGIMTHMLQAACHALTPYLKALLADERFFNERYDPDHVGDIEIPKMGTEAYKTFKERFLAKLREDKTGVYENER